MLSVVIRFKKVAIFSIQTLKQNKCAKSKVKNSLAKMININLESETLDLSKATYLLDGK